MAALEALERSKATGLKLTKMIMNGNDEKVKLCLIRLLISRA